MLSEEPGEGLHGAAWAALTCLKPIGACDAEHVGCRFHRESPTGIGTDHCRWVIDATALQALVDEVIAADAAERAEKARYEEERRAARVARFAEQPHRFVRT